MCGPQFCSACITAHITELGWVRGPGAVFEHRKFHFFLEYLKEVSSFHYVWTTLDSNSPLCQISERYKFRMRKANSLVFKALIRIFRYCSNGLLNLDSVDILGLVILCYWREEAVLCNLRYFSSISDLYLLFASSTSPASCDNPKCLQSGLILPGCIGASY